MKSKSSQSCGCIQKEKAAQTGWNRKKHNKYNLNKEHGIGYTTNTNSAFYFDLEDYNKIKEYTWMEDKDNYIWAMINKRPIRMHRFILGVDDDRIIDHKNRDRKDNRKINIRVATWSVNNHNTNPQKNNKTGKKGVHKHSLVGYIAAMTFRGDKRTAYFVNIEDAIEQRRQWEMEFFGYYFDN